MRGLAFWALGLGLLTGCPSEKTAAPPEAPKQRPPDPQPPALKLPGDVRPKGYGLDLTLVPDATKASGTVRIELEIVKPLRVVWLNATGLTFGKATIDQKAARIIPGGEDFVGLTLDAELQPGRRVLELAFESPIDRQKSLGIYSEQEGDDRYAYTFFEPLDARRAFPCFDEPVYKVPWQLTLHVKQEHVALGNAPVAKETPEPNGMKRVELQPSKPMPSYLVAFVVGPFELVDGGKVGRIETPLRFVVPKGRAGELQWAKQVTPRVVAALEQYFDIDYPFVKLDVAVVPRDWGTMEHPGLVAMGQPLTLIRPEQESRSRKQEYTNILAHELGHYWFGDYVTMAWWDDTWLNEGLTQWLDLGITDAVEPQWRLGDTRVGRATAAMSSDETLSTQSIRQSVDSKEAIQASFDGSITYDKTASVMRMFESAAGAARWQGFMRSYLHAYAWGNASADALFAVASAELGEPVAAGLKSFLEQPGVPRIELKVDCTKGAKLTVRQQRSLPAGVVDPQPKLWKLPVCVRYGADAKSARACVQLEAAEGELQLESCPKWVVPNADATGYYRSVVDPAVVKALLTPSSPIAKAAKPTPAERMMLIADVRAMVKRDELPIDKQLELVPLVVVDADDKVAEYAFAAASFRGAELDDAYYARSKRYLMKSFGPAAKKLGWKRAATDSDERHELRRSFVGAVASEDAALRKEAEALADKWLETRVGIEDDMVGSALTAAAAYGKAERFEKVLAAAKVEKDRTEKERLLSTLGAFRDPEVVKRALAIVQSEEIDLRDSIGILYGLLFTRETRVAARAFVKDHIDELLARMREDEASWFLAALAGSACTPEWKQEVAALVGPRAAKLPGAQAPVTRGLEQSDQCVAASERLMPSIKKFLDRY